MALISMRNMCWGFGEPPLLENLTFRIESGQRVCLLGRNGVGKSSLLKLIAGEIVPDSGDIWRQQGITVAALEQDVPPGFQGTIFDVVAQGLGETGKALCEYHQICQELVASPTSSLTRRQAELQQTLDAADGWELQRQVENVLSRTRLEPETKFADLSAGMKRRTLFARALAGKPDLLLLDEPTNHLDIEAIIWMEEFILRHVKSVLFITHDRAFLKKIASHIMELDRGRLTAYDCDYSTYLNRRQAALEAEEKQDGVFDKKLSQEEAWIRKGIKARRTRNEGRVRALKKMRAAYSARRQKIGNARLRVQDAEKTGKRVIEAKAVNFSHAQHPIITDFSTEIMRGDKVGIIGPNGVGKTTLLNILLKNLTPQSGHVHHGTRLQVAYFDQLRAQLDAQKTVTENIGEGNDYIIFNGEKRHVMSHLQDFLFSPERCRTPVYVLSGGEKNRLLLAKLFTKPANVLVLDEPTNDLDVETLELLEELLLQYEGTVLLVSHDRAFLNNVVTSTIAFEKNGSVIEYAGGYDDWLMQRPQPVVDADYGEKAPKKQKPRPRKTRKLGFSQQRELKELPKKIDALESRQQELYDAVSDPLFYKKDKQEMAAVKAQLVEVESDTEAAYLRWEELEEMAEHDGKI
jgi:ABC transport system ATP-binding/permease protein